MNEKDKNLYIDEFKKAEGSIKLDMWDYALGHQVLWEQIIVKMQDIAHEQGVDGKLEKLIEEEMKKDDGN